MISFAERRQLDRIMALFIKLDRLTRREIAIRRWQAEVRSEVAELVERPRSEAANAELSARLTRRFGKARP